MTLPTVLFEVYLNGSWVDLSSRVELKQHTVSITRGRDNEQGEVSPATAELHLSNDDGALTEGNPSSPYYPYWRRWVQCRLSVGGVRRITGWAQSIVASGWIDEAAAVAMASVSIIDIKGIMALSPNLDPWATELISELSPLYWWQLDDIEGSTRAAPSAGSRTLDVSTYIGSAATVTVEDLIAFGETSIDTVETASGVGFTPEEGDADVDEDGAFATLVSSGTLTGLPTLTTGITVLVVYVPPPKDQLYVESLWQIRVGSLVLDIERWNGRRLMLQQYSSNGETHASLDNFFTLGKPMLIAVTITTTQIRVLGTDLSIGRVVADRISLDGSTIYLGGGPTEPRVLGGGLVVPAFAPAVGVFSNLAILPTTLTDSQYLSLRGRVLGDGSASAVSWVQRASSYADVATSVQNLGTNRPCRRPALKGSNPAAVGDGVAAAIGSTFAVTAGGVPALASPSYLPVSVSLSMSAVDPDSLSWAADPALYVTQVSDSDTGKVLAKRAGFPLSEVAIDPLMSTADMAYLATGLIAGADVSGGPRLSGLVIDMLSADLSTLTVGHALASEIRPRVILTGAPTQTPSTQWPVTVEGTEETIGFDEWTLALNTAPDPRIVLDDSVAVLNTYRLGL